MRNTEGARAWQSCFLCFTLTNLHRHWPGTRDKLFGFKWPGCLHWHPKQKAPPMKNVKRGAPGVRKQIHSFVCGKTGTIQMEPKAMDVKLTPEQEKIVQEELNSGRFRSIEEVIGEALQVLREKDQSSAAAASNGSQGEAVREMFEFVQKNRVRLEGVSIKQLIHEGHWL
jgi:putative addiction module CopG family antidote